MANTDFAYALRTIRKMPVIAAVIVGSIAVGIGVNTTVFSWIQARVLSPIPGAARGSDFYLLEPRGENGSYPGLSWREYLDLAARDTAFRDVVAFRMTPLNVGAADWSERTYGLLVSGNYFSALDLRAQAGRLITADDTSQPGATAVAIISRRFWQARLAGVDDVVGRTLRVNDRPFTIVGIAPESFQGTVMGLTFDLWLPATAAPLLFEGTRELDARDQREYEVLANLKPGVSRFDASRDFNSALRDLARTYPNTNAADRGDVFPQWQSPHGPQQSLMAALVLLQGVMLFVLVVVVGNTTNLMLARATARRQESGIMLALGASRWRVIRLVLTENLLLASAGTALGALLAVWGTNALRSVPLPTPGGLELSFYTPVDGLSLAFACALGLLAGAMIGLPPALQLSRLDPSTSLRAGGAARARSTMRDVVLALEVAMAMVALVVAALFVKSFNDTRTNNPGFEKEGVLLAAYDLRGRDRALSAATAAEFAARLLDRLRQVPALESAALATSVPLDIHGMPSRTFRFDGRGRSDGSDHEALMNLVSPGYFHAMGIPVRAGADFAELRDRTAPPQAIVNETFVRRFELLSAESALGHRITAGGRDFVIAGVVQDSLYESFGETSTPFIYLSVRDRPSAMLEIHVRVRGGSEKAIAPELRSVVRELNPDLPLYNVRTLGEHVDANSVFRRIPARMFVVLGPLILLLVAIGIYAVVAYAVSQRRKEIGTRLALGATVSRVAAALVSDTLRLVFLGMAGGAVVALMIDPSALGRPQDALLLAGVASLFLATAVLASWLPARRASQINPMAVLKED